MIKATYKGIGRPRQSDYYCWEFYAAIILIAFILGGALYGLYCKLFKTEFVAPIPDSQLVQTFLSPLPDNFKITFAVNAIGSEEGRDEDNYSYFVETFAQEFAKSKAQKYQLIYQLHCLLKKESNYYQNKGHGDNGLAGGPLQFHQGTWVSMRDEMMKSGLIREVGSRYDVREAIRTTAWALVNGYGGQWGPIARGECK